VAVTLNDRLDYFGSTVNIASRLEGLSGARGGIVISPAVRDDPEVAEWLARGAAQTESFEAELKGFEGERFELWSVTARPYSLSSRATQPASLLRQLS
jgi:class 3 adenylate cyclase